MQSYSSDEDAFGERMFRYFYRIWDKFRYKNKDKSEIVAAAIYTYKGERGKDKQYVYKIPKIKDEILTYNFRIIDIEKLDLNKISDENPLKLVFKMAKVLLDTKPDDRDIYNAKIELAEELIKYDKVKNEEQIKALADFLEYLFLIQDKELENKYEKYKRERGGAVRMNVDQIRQKYYEQKGREQGREEGRKQGQEEATKKTAVNLLKMGISDEVVAEGTGLTFDEIKEIKKQTMN